MVGNMSKYLVTGGAGFIGSHLVEELVTKGNEVIIVDNLHTGSLDNITKYIKDIEFINKDTGGIILKDIKDIDGIFHLGISSSSPMYKENPSLVGKAINDFINMLNLSKTLNLKMVWASSSSIYNGNSIPWKEDMDIFVKDFYTEARYAMERLASLHHDWYGTKSIGLRFFSVYGPNERSKGKYANLVSQFLWDMKVDKSPIIYGDGEQRRDFIYVDDIISGIISAYKSNIDHDILNLGTGISYSLNDLVDIINESIGSSIKPVYVDNKIKNYIHETLADTKKTDENLNIKPKFSLKLGIKKILEKTFERY
ncbi:MAG: ADP-L-glycero-D-mannoheptose-6-epimerase [Candidatus Methanofastidiosum methylothiophilum]|uniref:ADP-L-glycero-D-mannoheptose-6-epimerase n=1 Tax=Candidatus Methanofastidiosum methylothiophilum TaxID=1705564 RepID=A0A150J8B2_9EURY|nr:MAG: ADP-L-glycero-D-mannoheptose-6-epimerase [Candidatus Methanofastidiosum methylthiophilus]